MSKIKLNRRAKDLIDVIKGEGATVGNVDNRSKHLAIEYTFDNVHFFTQTLPYGSSPADPRELKNLRAQLRRKRAAIPT
jgi:hypothetical protein